MYVCVYISVIYNFNEGMEDFLVKYFAKLKIARVALVLSLSDK